jgi:hypothetical protein
MRPPMQREIDAIERIERAVARIDAAAARSAQGSDANAELTRLRAAHEQLRERVRGAIGDIDQLLAGRGEAGA